MFSKIRRVSKSPNAKEFSDIYARQATASLIRAPITNGNCEDIEEEAVNNTAKLIHADVIADAIPTLNIENIEEILNYPGNPLVGRVFDDHSNTNSLSYYTGFITTKLNKLHVRFNQISLNECPICCNILVPSDLGVHLFTTFKEYSNKEDPN